MDLLPQLSSLFNLNSLPKNLGFISSGTTAALQGIYYKNYVVNRGIGLGTASFYIELVSYKVLRLGITGTDFTLAINEEDFVAQPGRPASPLTVIPLAGSYRWGILAYLPAYDITQTPLSAAADFLNLADQILPSTPEAQFSAVFEAFVAQPIPDLTASTSRLPQLQAFANTLRTHYGAVLVLANPLIATTEAAAAQEILVALAGADIEVMEMARDLYILPSGTSPSEALTALDRYFYAANGFDLRAYLLDLLIPEVSVATKLAAAIEFPRSVLLPLRYDDATSKYVAKEAPAKAKLNFAEGQFTFSNKAGFGYAANLGVSFPADQPRVQIGQTGLQVAFTEAKLDLSANKNIAEAEADGRPQNFRGVYVDRAAVFLPEGWSVQAGAAPPTIEARHLLIGIGGVSGTFGVTSSVVNGWLIQARIFNDLSVNFSHFDFSFSHNEVTSSNIKGEFQLADFNRIDGTAAKFPFALAFSAGGYRLAFNGTANPVVVRLGTVGLIRFTKLAIGYEAEEWYIEIAAEVELNKFLPIVGKALPRKINVQRLLLSTNNTQTALDIQPIWADGTSVSGNLTTGLSITQVINLSILDVIQVDLFRLSIARAQNGDITALATINAQLRLTPESSPGSQNSKEPPRGFVAKVNNVGFHARFSFRQGAEGGNLGPAEVTLDFKLPDTVAISINAEGISGSGHLAILNNGERYEGTLALTFRDKIKVSAYAILLDRLPSGEPGPSLLVVVMAQFTPIQLGLGFTLSGVGGLIGLHRSVSIPVLRGALASGSLDKILFPSNPSANTAQILSSLDSAFPPDFGRHTFGLLAKIGWGTPTLLTLDVGLIIELPAPVRLVLLGVLQATLPSLDKPILRLRADFLGSVDFGAGSVEFDATLRDSSILDRFPLSGDGAFRLYQGQNPVFLLTTGGFHPAFQPPANANLRPLQRLRLALADSRDFRLVLQTYLAITANTVQVGARLDLFVDLPLGFSLEGHLFFDTLFQFNPFRLDVQIGAGVAIKRNGNNKLTLQLYLHVTGPAPWHVTGEVSFKLIVRVRFHINRTIGGGAPAQPLPNVDVRQLLRQALAAPSSWEVQAPASAPTSPVVLRAEADATRLLVDPGGALVVRQKVAPLAYALERYGNARPENGNRFDLTQATLGTGTGAQLLTGADLAEITDFFAPGQFRQMSEAQRLSAASFQLMRSGVRLRTLEGLTGGPATVQQVGYELLVLASPVAAGTPIIAPAQPEASLVASAPVAEGTERRRMVDMPALQFQQLSEGSTINQAYATAQPSYLAPAEVYWQEDEYVLVRADTLTRYAATRYANEAQATAALDAVVAADARLRGELLVMPAYQLALV